MNQTTVHLVRHGEHEVQGRRLCGREPGVGLSAEGERQARALGRRFRGGGIAAVFASPMARARRTAASIAEACGLSVEVEPTLDEIDFGDWTGLDFETLDRDPRWTRWNLDRGRTRPPGGESMAEAQLRVAGWLGGLVGAGERRVVAVSHADTIRAALAWALGLPLQFHDRFEISPGSVSTVVVGDWGMKVHSINEATHD